MASDGEKRLMKELLNMFDTAKLCEIVRSVFHGGGVMVYSRDDAELLLLAQPMEHVLMSRKLPIPALLKFLISKRVGNIKPDVSRYELCSAFKLLVSSQPDYVQRPAQYEQLMQPVAANSMCALSQNNNMMHHQSLQPCISQMHMMSVTEPARAIIPNTKSKKDRNSELLEEFIEMFSGHFYNLLNDLGTPGKDQLDGCHFYENCTLAVKILGGSEEIVENCVDSTSTLQCLLGIKNEHKLFFSPNLGDGVKWKKETHGLVKVHVGGTLHQGVGRMVGMFEQQFILREDPHAANTWKILNTNLMMKNMDSMTAGPKLSIQGPQIDEA